MINTETLVPLMDLIEQKLSGVTTDHAGDYAAYRDSLRKLEQELIREAGARFALSSGALTMRLAGVSTSCTAGLPNLLHNWLNAARRKVALAGCANHVASRRNPKVCGRCGTHVDDERQDDGFNPCGSGPTPVQEREALS